MIACERRIASTNRASRMFLEWASIFGADYFVMIVVYADESGTHDPTGREAGSGYPIIAGLAAKKSAWDSFCIAWRAVLQKFDDVPYFHSRELRNAREAIVHGKPVSKDLQKNIYYVRGWDTDKIERFRVSLTRVAASGQKIPIAGAINIRVFNTIRTSLVDQDPYKYCMGEFFKVYHAETLLQWGHFRSDVAFVFDQSDKKEWREAIHEVFDAHQKHDPRMTGPNFGDKKKTQFVPLQAADLLAYRLRQLIEDWGNGELKLEPLDEILLGNLMKSAAIKFPHLKPFIKK